MLSLLQLFLVIFAGFFGALPILLLKEYTNTKHEFYITLSVVSYLILTGLYSVILSYTDIHVIYILIKILSIIFVIFGAWFIYEQKINNYQILGFILGIIAVYLLSLKD